MVIDSSIGMQNKKKSLKDKEDFDISLPNDSYFSFYSISIGMLFHAYLCLSYYIRFFPERWITAFIEFVFTSKNNLDSFI